VRYEIKKLSTNCIHKIIGVVAREREGQTEEPKGTEKARENSTSIETVEQSA